MILNVRGTNGSGKTHLVRSLLGELGGGRPIYIEGGPKTLGYEFPEHGLRVLGRYDSAIKGGGVDNITDYLWHHKFDGRGNSMHVVELQLRAWATEGWHVLLEGLIVTSVWARWLRLAEEIPWLFLFLDTPLAVCFDRTVARNGRVPKGWPGHSSLEDKWHDCHRQIRLAEEGGVPHEVLPYENALSRLQELVLSLGGSGPPLPPTQPESGLVRVTPGLVVL